MGQKLRAYLQLCRPANLPTAAADILAGLALAGFFDEGGVYDFSNMVPVIKLISASVLLYAGGVVLNDFFDADLDRVERPERPIPSGVVSGKNAFLLGALLLLLGVMVSFTVHLRSGLVAVVLTLCILAYDSYSKKHKVLGPLNMGVCRALNLLLGISVFGQFTHLEYLVIPLLFISAVTLVSRGEVHGKNQNPILLAAFLYVLVICCVIFFQESKYMATLPFVVLFALMVFMPLFKAYKANTPENIMKAVKAGVLSIILLNAAIAVGHSNVLLGILMLLLLPLSILLSKIFSVT
ncbi:MAG: ubiquinone biosynthesis protein UbiA [Muricauda sp.]|nr:UbiA-like protein EboC [Allomuricauda sp.]MBC31397.1 ubiquinone biosynthesis protein UbiA [Allomuricauda sp.]|tara:strand:+ start:4263 stop:5147 length:885 start_codon:yes stop_codon:yes gene_type:complete